MLKLILGWLAEFRFENRESLFNFIHIAGTNFIRMTIFAPFEVHYMHSSENFVATAREIS